MCLEIVDMVNCKMGDYDFLFYAVKFTRPMVVFQSSRMTKYIKKTVIFDSF